MASPMVAGLAGLVWSVNPSMSKTDVENCILNNADNIDSIDYRSAEKVIKQELTPL